MRTPITFLAGLLCGVMASAGAATFLVVDLMHHDATGRTQHATARLNSMSYDYGFGTPTVSIEYTSDQVWCSGFGP